MVALNRGVYIILKTIFVLPSPTVKCIACDPYRICPNSLFHVERTILALGVTDNLGITFLRINALARVILQPRHDRVYCISLKSEILHLGTGMISEWRGLRGFTTLFLPVRKIALVTLILVVFMFLIIEPKYKKRGYYKKQ